MAVGSIDSWYVAGSLYRRFFRQPTLHESAYVSGTLFKRFGSAYQPGDFYRRSALNEAQRLNRQALQAANIRLANVGITAATATRPILNIRV